MISPTKSSIRGTDNHGSGKYGASRGNRLHKGIDFICQPGQRIYSPIDGKIARIARPYADTKYSGCVIKSEDIEIKMFYFKPIESLIGTMVK